MPLTTSGDLVAMARILGRATFTVDGTTVDGFFDRKAEEVPSDGAPLRLLRNRGRVSLGALPGLEVGVAIAVVVTDGPGTGSYHVAQLYDIEDGLRVEMLLDVAAA